MNTKFLNPGNEEDLQFAGKALRKGELICIPTETVYGLAADALNPDAVKSIYEVKGRPSDNPLIVHISDFEEIYPLVKEVPDSVYKLAEAFWPGPLTIILPKSDIIPDRTSGGLATVAVRFPSNPCARAVIKAAGRPLAAPSANISGKPSPTSFSHCVEDLNGKIAGIFDGGDCNVGVESTVITLAEGLPRVLRPGGITVEMLTEVLGDVIVDDAVVHGLKNDEKAASPGMKYKHYSPSADITIADMSKTDFIKLMNNNPECGAFCFEGEESLWKNPSVTFGKEYDGVSQANRLFSALKELDEKGIKKVFSRRVQKSGVGLAVYNRLIRSAGFNVIKSDVNIIGLTGKTGAGKGYVSALFEKMGAKVIDCDKITKLPDLYDADCLSELKSAFGASVINSDGTLNRRETARIAFSTVGGKEKLESITFPRIINRIKTEIDKLVSDGAKEIVLDAPTLFDSGLDDICSRIVVVDADENVRLKRIIERDNISESDALLRMKSQKDLSMYADVIIFNNGNTDLESEVKNILIELREEI